MTTLVVMGVSGVGKTAVAREIVARTGCGFAEGDDFHPAADTAKMAAGHPLDDDDRRPWLHRIADWIGAQEAAGRSTVVTCPALTRTCRDLLRDGHPSVRFVHLLAPPEVIRGRITARTGHSMPPSSLDGQLAILQDLQQDEPGCAVDTTGSPAAVAELALFALLQGAPRQASAAHSAPSTASPGHPWRR